MIVKHNLSWLFFYMQVSTIQELVTGYEASLKTCDLFSTCGKFLWSYINYTVIILFMAAIKNCWSADTFCKKIVVIPSSKLMYYKKYLLNFPSLFFVCYSNAVFNLTGCCNVSILQKTERKSPQRHCFGFDISWHSTLTNLASVLWPWITLMLQLQALQH